MDNIAIVGKMASGKTTFANKLNEKVYKNKACIARFAGPIKEIYENRELLSSYRIVEMNSEFSKNEKTLLEYEPFMKILEDLDNNHIKGTKPRKHYQFLGDFFKEVYGQDFWAKKLFEDFKTFYEVQSYLQNEIEALIIDDLRMKIEYETILNRKENFIIFCLELKENERLDIIKNLNLGSEDTLNHNSETEVDEIIGEIKSISYDNMYMYDNDKRIVTIYSTKNKINKKLLNKVISSILN